MKRSSVFLLLLLLLPLLSCGGGTSPGSYVYTDDHQLMFLKWSGDASSLTGFWSFTIYDLSSSSFTKPKEGSYTLGGGKIDGQQVSFQNPLALSGEVQSDGKLSFDTVDGSATQRRTWYALSEGDYHQLLGAFRAHMAVAVNLKLLSDLLDHVPADSDGTSLDFSVIGAQDQVDFQRSRWSELGAGPGKCDQVRQFLGLVIYPISAQRFQLRDVSQSMLAQYVHDVDESWSTAKAIKLSSVGNLPLPWLFSQRKLDDAERTGKDTYAQLVQKAQQDQTKLDDLKSQYQSFTSQVDAARQACGV